MRRVDSLVSVVCSDDEHGIGGALEELPGQIFGLVVFGDLALQNVI
jgi:hypothetical protein